MIRAAIVGGTGYGGMELLRLSLAHPELEITALTSRSETGPVGERHPHLRGFTDLCFQDVSVADLAADNDLLFFATPHGVASEQVPVARNANPRLRIVDLSGDHRLATDALYQRWYGRPHGHLPSLDEAVYGLPECGGREAVRGAWLVANPGCHATATLLALWPVVQAGLVDGPIAVSSVTGSSGSGASPGAGTHHPSRAANFKAYRPLEHQHLPEIEGALAGPGGEVPRIGFVPHSAPLARGIAVTAWLPVAAGQEDEAAAAVRNAYEGEPLVRLVPGTPEVRAVAGTACADVGVVTGDRTVVVMVAIDNLGKGMAGTAVQNANLLCGLDETTGLRTPGMGP